MRPSFSATVQNQKLQLRSEFRRQVRVNTFLHPMLSKREHLLDTFICGTTVMVIGIGLNIAMFVELQHIRLQSQLTPWLLRSQVIFDGFGCLFTILIFWVVKIPTHDDVTGALVCYLWDSQSAYWISIAASTCNLMCITLDRLLATVYCATYKAYQTRYIVGCCVAIFIYTILVGLPISLVVHYTNGTCETEARPEFEVAYATVRIHQALWAVVYYVLPLIFMAAVHFRVVWHIRHYFGARSKIAKDAPSTVESGDDGRDAEGKMEAQSRSVIKSLTVGTFTLITTMVLAHSFDSLLYIFGPEFGIAYVVGSEGQIIGLLVNSLNCLANPIILAFSLPTMRASIFSHAREIRQWIKNVCHIRTTSQSNLNAS